MKTWKLVTTTLLSTLVIFGLGTATGHAIERSRVEEKVAAAKGHSGEHPTEQTWPKSYVDTRCSEWLDDMTPDERYVAATDLLGGLSYSATSLVDSAAAQNYITDVDAMCGAEIGQRLADVAYDVYRDNPGQYN